MTNSVMLAFLPTQTDWCKQDLPHMTLVYCGTTDTLKQSDYNALAKDAFTVANLTRPFVLVVKSVDQMGEGAEQVDALSLYPTPQLLTARQLVEKWNASQYKDFNPHATIGPVGSADGTLPKMLYFDRLILTWGDKQLTFSLGSSMDY